MQKRTATPYVLLVFWVSLFDVTEVWSCKLAAQAGVLFCVFIWFFSIKRAAEASPVAALQRVAGAVTVRLQCGKSVGVKLREEGASSHIVFSFVSLLSRAWSAWSRGTRFGLGDFFGVSCSIPRKS